MRPCKDCKKAHEMVLASMEYVKVLGFRIRKTEEISETWKKAAQTHAEECVKLDEQLHHLRTAAESGMLPQIVKERDALRAECDDHWQREGIEKQRRIDVEAQLSDTLADIGALFGVAGSVRSITAAIEKLKERNVELAAERERMKAELAVVKDERDTLRKERDGLMIQVQDMRAEIERLKKPARQHPVAVGEWVLRTGGGGAYPIGTVAQVNQYSPSGDYLVRLAGPTRIVIWFKQNCTPCDPPEATHDTPEGKQAAESVIRDDRKTEPKPGDTVRLVRIPSRSDVSPKLQTTLEWPWIERWGTLNQTALVVEPAYQLAGAVSVCLSANVHARWPICCVEVVRTEPDDIKAGDLVEVFQATDSCTFKTDIGTRGTVLLMDDSCVDTAPLDGFLAPKGNHVALCDVRKVTT